MSNIIQCPICFIDKKKLFKYECCKQKICKKCILTLIDTYKPCPFCRCEYDSYELYYDVKDYFDSLKIKKTNNKNKINYIKKNIDNIKNYKKNLLHNKTITITNNQWR